MAKPFSTMPTATPLGWCLVALSMALTPLAQADNYRMEVRGGLTQVDGNTANSDTLEGAASVYFSPVDTGNHPLAEAAFMERASSLTLSHRRIDFSQESPFEPGVDLDREHTVTRATLDYYSSHSPLFLSLSANRVTDEGTNGDRYSSTRWSGALGVTPVEGLLVTSNFYEGQDISDDWNLNARYVMPSRDFEAMAFEAGFDYTYGVQSARWSLDTYLDKTLSLGIGYARAISTTDDGTLELRARKFFTDRFSLSAFFSHHRRSDHYGLEAGLRF